MLNQRCRYTSEEYPYYIVKLISKFDNTLVLGYVVFNRVQKFNSGVYCEDCNMYDQFGYIQNRRYIDNLLSSTDSKIVIRMI